MAWVQNEEETTTGKMEPIVVLKDRAVAVEMTDGVEVDVDVDEEEDSDRTIDDKEEWLNGSIIVVNLKNSKRKCGP